PGSRPGLCSRTAGLGAVSGPRGSAGPSGGARIELGERRLRRAEINGRPQCARGTVSPVVPHRSCIEEIPSPSLYDGAVVHIIRIMDVLRMPYRLGMNDAAPRYVYEAAQHARGLGIDQNRVGLVIIALVSLPAGQGAELHVTERDGPASRYAQRTRGFFGGTGTGV